MSSKRFELLRSFFDFHGNSDYSRINRLSTSISIIFEIIYCQFASLSGTMALVCAAHIRKNACRIGAPEHANDIRAKQAIAYEIAFIGVVRRGHWGTKPSPER